MANILDQLTIGNAEYLIIDSNPVLNIGVAASIGSLAIDNTTGQMYTKTGVNNTDWSTNTSFSSGTKIVRYLNFGVTGNSGSPFVTSSPTSYTAIQDFVFNPSEHVISGSTLAFTFKAILGFANNGQSASVRLFNVTTNAAVSGSIISIPAGQPTPPTQNIYASSSLTTSSFGNSVDNVFECQVEKVLGSGAITVYGFQLAIINTF